MSDSDFTSAMQQFLLWEAASRDTIDFKKIYVDITGDLIAGLMLSQIIYWHLPNRDGESKLRVERDGYQWLAKAQHEWWAECRLTAKQVRRARKIMEEKGIIATAVYKFGGAPTTHIRIKWNTFLNLWSEELPGQILFDQKSKSILTKGQNPILPKVLMKLDDPSKSLTERIYIEQQQENTTETTTTTPGVTPDDKTAGGGGGQIENQEVYLFLVEKCGVWESKAQQLAAEEHVSLELAAHWWAVIKDDENIRNRAAVLVKHLEDNEQPPEFTDSRQRHRFQQYLWDYQSAEDLDDEEAE